MTLILSTRGWCCRWCGIAGSMVMLSNAIFHRTEALVTVQSSQMGSVKCTLFVHTLVSHELSSALFFFVVKKQKKKWVLNLRSAPIDSCKETKQDLHFSCYSLYHPPPPPPALFWEESKHSYESTFSIQKLIFTHDDRQLRSRLLRRKPMVV